MKRLLVALFLAALCLPPDIPSLESMIVVDRKVHNIEGMRETENYMILDFLYKDVSTNKLYAVYRLLGAIALVDDNPMDNQNTSWWIDGGMLTDDPDPRVVNDPKPTCQFHRRADKT